jgi:hypothetical protein
MFTGTTQEVRQDKCSTEHSHPEKWECWLSLSGRLSHTQEKLSQQSGGYSWQYMPHIVARGCWHDNMDTCDDIKDHFLDELEHI